ncbi:MAG: efflux RND transporter periplasmic adaptor subunit [Armatimonadota bacterium]
MPLEELPEVKMPVRTRRFVLVGIGAIAIVTLLAIGLHVMAERQEAGGDPGESAQPGPSAPPAAPGAELPLVEVATAQTGEVAETLTLRSGTVEARDEVDLAAQASGTVDAVLVSEGDEVRKGQVLVKIESEALQAQVDQARASVKLAQARLSQAKHGTSLQTAEADTQIGRAQSQLKAARAQLAQAQEAADLQSEATDVQIEQARAALTAAQAQLDEVRRGAREQERKRAQLLVDQAKAAYDLVNRGLPKRRRLFEGGAISADEFGQYVAEYEVRKAQYESAVQALDLVEEGATSEQVTLAQMQVVQAQEAVNLALANRAQNIIRRQDIESAQAGVEAAQESLRLALAGAERIEVSQDDVAAAEASLVQARASVVLAMNALDKATVRSPLSGIVSIRLVDPGETVGPGIPLLRLLDIAQVDVLGTVLEADVPKARLGMPAEIRVDALRPKVFRGRVSEVTPAAIPNQRFFTVKVRVPNPERELRPGMFARVELVQERRSGVVLIPWDAVAERDGRQVVFVVENGRTQMRDVELGIRKEALIEVKSGVRAGQRVIVSGQPGLEDGQQVETTLSPDWEEADL